MRAINAFGIGDGFPTGRWSWRWTRAASGPARATTRAATASGAAREDYHQKVDLAFRMIAAEEPDRVRLVDASGVPEEVTQRLLDAIADLLP